MKLSIDQIIVTDQNPRTRFNIDALRELGESIKSHGQLQPIIVRPRGSKYELVVGERRLRASVLVGLESIEAQVRDIDDVTVYELRLVENVHREDLTNAEKGDAVLALWALGKYDTIKEVAESLNIKYVRAHIWIAKSRKLTKNVKQLIVDNKLTERAAKELLKYPPKIQDKLAQAIVQYNVRGGRRGAERIFLDLYDQHPDTPLEDLANEALGKKTVVVSEQLLTDAQKQQLANQAKEAEILRKAKPRRVKRNNLSKKKVRQQLGITEKDFTTKTRRDTTFVKAQIRRGSGNAKPLTPTIQPITVETTTPIDYSICQCATCSLWLKHCRGRCWNEQ